MALSQTQPVGRDTDDPSHSARSESLFCCCIDGPDGLDPPYIDPPWNFETKRSQIISFSMGIPCFILCRPAPAGSAYLYPGPFFAMVAVSTENPVRQFNTHANIGLSPVLETHVNLKTSQGVGR